METKELVTVIAEEEIRSAIRSVASEYAKKFENEQVTLVSELSGTFVFIADLIREMPIDAAIQFVTKDNEKSDVKINLNEGLSLENKNVIIVADILNNGNTVNKIHKIVKAEKPKSIEVLALIERENKNRKVDLNVRSLFNIKEEFLVGYGLTRNESYRGLKGIYRFSDKK